MIKNDAMQKNDSQAAPVERTSSRRAFTPHTDIIEREASLEIVMDVPGAVEKNIDIDLEDDVLTVTAAIDEKPPEGFRAIHAEYGLGDFHRSFRLLDDFDGSKIQASLKNGVLTLVLPKSERAKPRKIQIKSLE